MVDPAYLLDDDAVKRFIVEGWLLVRPEFPPAFHREVCRQIEEVLEKEGNPGNGILERVPALGEVYAHPVVRGALVSLLGEEYRMNPHRHCHVSRPGFSGQQWHQ